jgi:phage host-nuclease inhibitor protein Gam
MPRITKKLNLITSRDGADEAMTVLAIALTSKQKVIADRDATIARINDNCAGPLAELDAVIDAKTDALCAWAESNPTLFQKGSKSLALANGVIGFRTGTPKVALLNRRWNWDKVLEQIKALGRLQFVRNKEEVDKEAIQKSFAENQDAQAREAACAEIGVKVTQDESFYADAKLSTVETRQTKEAA